MKWLSNLWNRVWAWVSGFWKNETKTPTETLIENIGENPNPYFVENLITEMDNALKQAYDISPSHYVESKIDQDIKKSNKDFEKYVKKSNAFWQAFENPEMADKLENILDGEFIMYNQETNSIEIRNKLVPVVEEAQIERMEIGGEAIQNIREAVNGIEQVLEVSKPKSTKKKPAKSKRTKTKKSQMNKGKARKK